jgi:hypothetical protein
LKATAQRPSSTTQIEQIELAVVVENDSVLQGGFDQRSRAQSGAVQFGIDVFQRFHLHLQAEGDFQRRFTGARSLQFDLVRVAVHPNENLRERDILLGVEILRQLLITEYLIAH